MRKSDRLSSKNRIDYKVLSTTGEVKLKSSSEGVVELSNLVDSMTLSDSEVMENAENKEQILHSYQIECQSLCEDINDFIEENQVDETNCTPQDVDAVIVKIEVLRSKYRTLCIQLKVLMPNFEETHGKSTQNQLDKIKRFIKFNKDIRNRIRKNEGKIKLEEHDMVQRSLEFQIGNTKISIAELHAEVNVNVKKMSDAEILRRKKEMQEIRQRMNTITSDFKELLGKLTHDMQVSELTERYEILQSSISQYSAELTFEFDKRDLEKEKLFKASHLNIKLPKFKGYASVDIYSFQRDFEKLHLRITPRNLLPDLLKNNYLEEPALSLVKCLEDIDEIWERLKTTYGNPKTMLERKLDTINEINQLWKFKDPEKVMDGLSKVITIMKDLMSLSKRHDIESKLYYGNGLEKIYRLLGDGRVTRWLTTSCDEDLDGKELWMKLVSFLEKELKVQQQRHLILQKTDDSKFNKSSSREAPRQETAGKRYHTHHASQDEVSHSFNLPQSCFICGASDHVSTNGPNGSKLVQYFACKRFTEMTPSARFLELKKKNLCFQCLFPGANGLRGKHREGRCQRDYVCPHESHDKYPSKMHVLVCNEHKENPQNQELLQKYKDKCILRQTSVNLPDYSKQIKLVFHSQSMLKECYSNSQTITDSAIYQLQEIIVNNQRFLIFFDNGCSDFVIRYDAVKKLGSKAKLEFSGPIKLGGVGDVSTESTRGVYSVKLPTHDDNEVVLTGVSLEKITSTFPNYPLDGKVLSDIHDAFQQQGGNVAELPKLPTTIGGDVDFMIGVKYLRYHPEQIFQLPSGLTIYRSCFKNADGGRGVIGGPHRIFTAIERHHHVSKTFLSKQYQLWRTGYQVNPDISLLGFKDSLCETEFDVKSYIKREKIFNMAEEAGSEISYRCIQCRSCNECKNHDDILAASINEEIEQDLINKSVTVDTTSQCTIASLPLMHEAELKLSPNRHKALRVYQQQAKKLNKYPDDKKDVIESESKLQQLGHVDFVANLPSHLQQMLLQNKIQNFIPWRAVWKTSSISTPCRVVFDASQPTDTGYSLNSILAKGKNGMNKLNEIMIRWFSQKIGFHTDVRKMYNTVKLRESDWCFQRYLWNDQLDPQKVPSEKVIKTLIYGVKSSGNQSERGLRLTSELSKDQYPEVHAIISKDVYVDDCISGEKSIGDAMKRADQMETVLSRGGFCLKGFTFSGKDPLDALSADGNSISVAGMLWFPKGDFLSLDINELNFARRHRGKKPVDATTGMIPSKLTRRHCVSKVSEIFDLTGRITPITAAMKLDLHDLVIRGLDWDDCIPDNLKPIWNSHFEMMQEIKTIKFKRTVIPEDAANLNITTIDFGDASKSIACAAIYSRILRTNGEYCCQLLFSRSKLLPESITQPRAELVAALLNTHTGEVVKRALNASHQRAIKLTDSQIVLHWLHNHDITLKPWVRNRVVEIRRFSDASDWKYVNSSNMLADIATRKGATLDDVQQHSEWISGADWMKTTEDKFPTKTVSEIILTMSELREVKKESPSFNATEDESKTASYITHTESLSHVSEEIQKRYSFSKYLIDPNKFRFKKVIRILAIVFKFINMLQCLAFSKKNHTNEKSVSKVIDKSHRAVFLTEEEISKAEQYFFKKGTLEVKHFVKESKYKNITQDVKDILIYTGRILSTDEVHIVTPMTTAMMDLHATMFCVPVLDKHSPISYAIVNEIHWHDKAVQHAGVESVLRYVLKKAFIIEGREIVKRVKIACNRCRFLKKKNITVEMGKVHDGNITVAPAYYVTQLDLAGPFMSYSNHNKRATVKIWLVIFCCATTSATTIKVMEDYSTSAFLQAFIRFSCQAGYPKKLIIDAGSQLVKGCGSIKLNFQDLKFKLHHDVSVDFDICPVGGHNVNGKVERKIREIRSSLEKVLIAHRLSIMQWETVSTQVANSINDLPLALGSIVSDFETMDLITPNRLCLGRNNDRSPVGILNVTGDFDKIMRSNNAIFNAWFDNWLVTHVPKLMNQPKWFKSDTDIKIGDVILFLKNDSILCPTYQYGLVKEVVFGKDGKIRKAIISYRNSNESINRESLRAVRELVVIHHADEINVSDQLNRLFKSC